jgi:hypothetical protein
MESVMAVRRTIICDTCHEQKDVMIGSSDSPPKSCGECSTRKAADERQAALEALAALPVEERLRRVEEFIYDHRRSYHASRPVLF